MRKLYIALMFLIITSFTLAASNEAHILKFKFYVNMSEYAKASEELKFIDFDNIKDGKALLYNEAGFVYYNMNDFGKALWNYYKALKLNPDLYFVYNNIGVIFFQLKDYEKAKGYYLKAYEKNRDYPKVLINLAIVDFYLKNFEGAYRWFKKALLCDKKYIKKRFKRNKAVEKLSELIKQNPEDRELKRLLKWAEKKENLDEIMDF